MIFAADRCRGRAPHFYVAEDTAQVEGILNPRIGDVAMTVVDGSFDVWVLIESDIEPDGVNYLPSNSICGIWAHATISVGGIVGVFYGLGSPEGVLAKGLGSIYTDISDPQHPVVYVKTGGGITSSGWVLVVAI